ncbi:MAG TPA: ATP-binding cassette domain-containing protein [Polyangiaceae bacterium]
MLHLQRASSGTLNHCSLTLEAGLHVILGHERDGTSDLIDLIAGSRAPRAGSVRVRGLAPHRSPALRQSMAVLRASEELFPARSVGEAVRVALTERGVPTTTEAALAQANLSHWAGRHAAKLNAHERRAVAASVVFSMAQPALAALHEPLAYLPGISPELGARRIASWVAAGCLVVCTTSSPAAVQTLGGSPWILERGGVLRPIAARSSVELAPGRPTTLLVRSTSARELAAALSRAPGVTAAAFDEAQHASQVRVQGADAKTLSLTVARVAREHALHVEAIVPSVPDLEVTRAASAGYLRAAYEAAYYSARAQQQDPAWSAHARS